MSKVFVWTKPSHNALWHHRSETVFRNVSLSCGDLCTAAQTSHPSLVLSDTINATSWWTEGKREASFYVLVFFCKPFSFVLEFENWTEAVLWRPRRANGFASRLVRNMWRRKEAKQTQTASLASSSLAFWRLRSENFAGHQCFPRVYGFSMRKDLGVNEFMFLFII